MTTPGEFPGFTSPDEVIAFCRDRGIQMVDLKFTDVPGTLQHVTIPLGELKPDVFVEGTGFDGSSIRGFQQIQESDMLLVPDATTGTIDPFFTVPTLSLICKVKDPESDAGYSRDPRFIAQKAEAFLQSSGLGRRQLLGPRAGVLHLRLRAVRPDHQQRLLLHRLGRGRLELRKRVE